MANLSQGAPGVVDTSNAPVTLVHEHTSDIGGNNTVVHTFSDGSRKIYVGGVLQNDVALKSDEEKIATPINSGQLSDLNESQKNEIRAQHPGVADSELFTAVVVPAVYAAVANVEALAVPTEEELAAIAEKAAEEAQAAAEAVEAAAKEAAEAAEVEAAKLAADAEAALAAAEAEAAKDAPEVEGFIAQTADKIENVVKEVVDAATAEFKDLEFKSIADLKELAEKFGIDLGDAKKKDEILAKITDSQA